jgi:hypothetical protein
LGYGNGDFYTMLHYKREAEALGVIVKDLRAENQKLKEENKQLKKRNLELETSIKK